MIKESFMAEEKNTAIEGCGFNCASCSANENCESNEEPFMGKIEKTLNGLADIDADDFLSALNSLSSDEEKNSSF